jgi:hypothetical protein
LAEEWERKYFRGNLESRNESWTYRNGSVACMRGLKKNQDFKWNGYEFTADSEEFGNLPPPFLQLNKIQHSTTANAQRNATQHNTTRNNTTQRSIILKTMYIGKGIWDGRKAEWIFPYDESPFWTIVWDGVNFFFFSFFKFLFFSIDQVFNCFQTKIGLWPPEHPN